MKKLAIVLIFTTLLSGCAGLTSNTPKLAGPKPKPMPNRPQGLKVDTKGDSVCMPPEDYEEVMDYIVDLETWAKNNGGTR